MAAAAEKMLPAYPVDKCLSNNQLPSSGDGHTLIEIWVVPIERAVVSIRGGRGENSKGKEKRSGRERKEGGGERERASLVSLRLREWQQTARSAVYSVLYLPPTEPLLLGSVCIRLSHCMQGLEREWALGMGGTADTTTSCRNEYCLKTLCTVRW